MLKTLEAILLALINIIFTYYGTPFLRDAKASQYIIFAILLTFFYYAIVSKYDLILKWLKRKILRYFIPKIGILNGQIDSNRNYGCKFSWAGVRPLQWKSGLITRLKKSGHPLIKLILFCTPSFLVKEIKAMEIDDSFFLIINPFGDNYPEEDTELHVTFFKIRRFIENGGIFVVTGGAFYFQQDTSKTPEPEQTMIRQYITERGSRQYLKDTLLCIKFGINTTGDGPEEDTPRKFYQTETERTRLGDLTYILTNKQFRRFRALTINSSCNFLPIVREIDHDYYPVALVKNGNGFLAHFGMHIVTDETPEFDLAAEVILRLIKHRKLS